MSFNRAAAVLLALGSVLGTLLLVRALGSFGQSHRLFEANHMSAFGGAVEACAFVIATFGIAVFLLALAQVRDRRLDAEDS